jgi:hypothetical protein
MQSLNTLVEALFVLDSVFILFIFVIYWKDYRKLRLKNDWTGIYLSYNVSVYNTMWDSYNTKMRRFYFWRPKSYKKF